jgi:4-deoxy-L-threo-5-hexosulose-uronate ketol-isomerase
MQSRYESSPKEVQSMNTQQLRENFLIDNLFVANEVTLTYSHYDRVVVGGVLPKGKSVELPNPDGLKANFFLERREIGIINVGGEGKVVVEGQNYDMQKFDGLYVGKGVQKVSFESLNEANPAHFFLTSAPAHQTYPTRLMKQSEASPVHLGASETANQRTIFKYIHPEGIPSCQLVMGYTALHTGSIWNTMPPHTHDRRMEVYFYFDIPENQRVLHLMGQAEETRHLWMSNLDAVISPPWSIHSGAGTSSYAFIWAMAGENQLFTDMDFIEMNRLK